MAKNRKYRALISQLASCTLAFALCLGLAPVPPCTGAVAWGDEAATEESTDNAESTQDEASVDLVDPQDEIPMGEGNASNQDAEEPLEDEYAVGPEVANDTEPETESIDNDAEPEAVQAEDNEDLAEEAKAEAKAEADDEAQEESSEEVEIEEASEASSESIPYTGDGVAFANENGKILNALASQPATTVTMRGNTVVIDYAPKRTDAYRGFFLDADVSDDSTWTNDKYIVLNNDGVMHIELPKERCGYGWRVALIKKTTWSSTSTQYYLCIPSEESIYATMPESISSIKKKIAAFPDDTRSIVGTGMTEEMTAAANEYLALTDDERSQLADEEHAKLAKTLIAVLPHDSFTVTESDTSPVNLANSVYEMVPENVRASFDKEVVSSSRAYDRYLENAVWAVDSLGKVDDTTQLTNGTYTQGITSTSGMGKSTSRRAYGFTVKKITVKDGHAVAVIEHGATTSATVLLGGKQYPNLQKENNKKSYYEIPVDLNSTFHFSVKGKLDTAETDAITYEMTISLDENTAKPDKEPETDDGSSGGPTPGGEDGGNKPSDNPSGNTDSSPSQNPSNGGETPEDKNPSGNSGSSDNTANNNGGGQSSDGSSSSKTPDSTSRAQNSGAGVNASGLLAAARSGKTNSGSTASSNKSGSESDKAKTDKSKDDGSDTKNKDGKKSTADQSKDGKQKAAANGGKENAGSSEETTDDILNALSGGAMYDPSPIMRAISGLFMLLVMLGGSIAFFLWFLSREKQAVL